MNMMHFDSKVVQSDNSTDQPQFFENAKDKIQ